MRILANHGFYGLLLMHVKYAVDESVPTAYTDGTRITFGSDFLDELSDVELDFVMMHEIMHVVLRHCFRGLNFDRQTFNIACDIVVNSNILLENEMRLNRITLSKYGEAMHLAPDGKEGYEYTAEQVYKMLLDNSNYCKSNSKKNDGAGNSGGNSKGGSGSGTYAGQWDDHGKWGTAPESEMMDDVWQSRLKDAAAAISVRDPSNSRGLLPKFAERMLAELRRAKTDWRTVLNEFVQEDLVDYSFSPPDRRFDSTDFYLPDYNVKDDRVEDILFMIDTSGSMSDDMITAAYSEIQGALDQFDGKLRGWLGFFDAAVVEPKPFSTTDELRVIRPKGGGGTSFKVIFDYVRERMADTPPASIIILTDGHCPFPNESCAMGIPVLWMINNEEVTPPWGKVARIDV